MRSLSDIKRYKFLGKWITKSTWDLRDTYKCVGESDKYVYVWYSGVCCMDMDDLMVGEINHRDDLDYHSYDDIRCFSETRYATLSMDDKIKWIK
jgi:hypothetical protein